MEFPLESLIFREWFMLGTVKTTDMGLVGWGGEAMEAMEEVDSESNIRIKDIGLYAALIP
jgi:hypothetical protein